jgi:hypothetical protein
MRGVTQDIVSAWLAGEARRTGATRSMDGSITGVHQNATDGQTLRLWGSPIARKAGPGQGFEVTLAGFPTRLTIERVNGVCELVGSSIRFGTEDREPVAFDADTGTRWRIDSRQWITI